MTTAELVSLVVGRLDSMESSHVQFRKEIRHDIAEVKDLARATNGRVTALERKEIDEAARLDERQRVDAENAASREKRVKPARQIMVSVTAGVLVAVSIAALTQLGAL